ncbi:MAG: GyrI-like domain-containing protein [Bacteroidetes bacterium]|nr:GyrI-like domain-containing protein [Bacteroidota bacterium]
MEKLDFKKTYKDYYSAKQTSELLAFQPIPYLMISGKGEPGGSEFQQATEALFPLAYGIKKICKLQGKDFGVPALEGLWWTESNKPAAEVPRSEWHWKLMIRMPDFADKEMLKTALAEVMKKKKNPLLNNVSFETLHEEKCVQILHIGAYSQEQPTIDLMYDFMKKQNLKHNGLHHEIYLSDPRKTKPELLKTIIRQPVK